VPVNKAQVVARVARETGLTQADVARALDAFLDTVVRALRKGEPVKLVDFGTFLVTRRRSRPGHNPRTGQPMRIAGRRWPRFSAGKGLRQAVAERRPRGGAAARLDEPAPPPEKPARSRTATAPAPATPPPEGAPAPARPSKARPTES
jgi:DNA-binding protein HU-beta